MVVIRYQGPHTGVDVLGSDKMYTVARGETIDVPEDVARNLLQSPDWSLVEPADEDGPRGPDLISGLSSSQRRELVEAGYPTLDDLAAATDEELHAIPGIGSSALQTLRQALGQYPEE